MYNVYVRAEKAKQSLEAKPGTNHQFEFKLGGEKFTLTEKHIRFGVESVKAACNVSSALNSSVRGITSSESLCRAEQSFSCLYSRALDRFLFQDATKAACLHQAPSRVRERESNVTLEKVDIYALPFLANFEPDGPILVADLKNSNFGLADKESLLYAVNGVSEQCGPTHWPLQLGIPGTRNVSELQVYVPVDRGMWRLPIAQCSPYDPAFLCTLYVATNYLCRSGATTHLDGPPECPIPKEDMVGYRPLEKNNHRVFTDDTETYVFKLYDTQMEELFHVNRVLLETAGLKDVSVTDLSIDGRLQMLQYRFIRGNHEPISVGDFRGALESLRGVHSLGYIHGDIKIENIVFGHDGTSYLIDFDLARKQEDSPYYPKGYHYYGIRHRSARAGCPMDKEHDIFSMKKVMAEKFPAVKEQVEHILKTGELIQWIDQLMQS